MSNLMDGLLQEIERCEELVKVYDELGPVGAFGKTMVETHVNNAKRAITSNDVAEMAICYGYLKECE